MVQQVPLVARFALVATHLTGGWCLELGKVDSATIVKCTIDLILILFGVDPKGFDPSVRRLQLKSQVSGDDAEIVIKDLDFTSGAVDYYRDAAMTSRGVDMVARFWTDADYRR